MSTLYSDEDRKGEIWQQALRNAAANGRCDLETTRVAKDGRKVPASTLLQPMRDDQERLVGFVQVARNAARRREQDQDLRSAILMLNAMTDYEVILLDTTGTIRSWNRGAEVLRGYQSGEILGKHASIFYTEEDNRMDQTTRELDAALRAGRTELEGWRLRKGGGRFWANTILTVVRDEDGQHIGFVSVTRDLTERIERQKMMERQRDEILELSTPVIQVWDRVLALPIIGTLDSQRASRLTENLLQKIAADEAEFVILDISGVPTIDTQVAQHLLKTVQGARLMGAESIVSGVRPETAQAMVHLGIEIGALRSRATLRDALQLALRLRRDRLDASKASGL